MDINSFKNKLQNKGIHDGHRARLRESVYINGGFEGMADHEVLEYILSMFVPRKDTNPLAHELLNYFGSFSAVLDADVNDLIKINGIGKRCAVFLSSFKHILKRYKESKSIGVKLITNVKDVLNYIGDKIKFLPQEELYAIFLNARNGLISSKQLGVGSLNKVSIEPRVIVQHSLSLKAEGVILVHNHPSGVSTPSPEDIKLTRDIFLTLSLSGIHFLEHIIVSNNTHYSFKQNGYIDKFQQECDNWYSGICFKSKPPKFEV